MVFSENSRIFKWKNFNEWKSALEGMFKDILNPELEAKVKKNRVIVEYCDDREPFERLASQSIEAMITMEKINEFRQLYSYIRVYHGCRPTDVQSYYKKGILPSIELKNVQVKRFKEIFLSGDFTELTEEILQQSIERAVNEDEDLCLIIDDRVIIERWGHYLIYGSEYLSSLVSNLPIENSREKYLSVLREIGKPTLFEINLSNTIEYVSDFNLWELICDMIMNWTYNVAHSRTKSGLLDFTFSLMEPLLPQHVCSHYHPRKIRDSILEVDKIYDAETGKYEE